MLSLNKLRLVFLMCGFFTFCVTVATTICQQRSTTTGCGSCFCCQGNPYDPQKNTCCETDVNRAGKLTEGLSERMSQCCGDTAYNPLNEICCEQEVKPKPSHDAKCCGKESYDESKKICCTGKLLERLSPDHKCCYGKLYDSSIENCCQGKFPRIQMKINNFEVCVKNFTGNATFSEEPQSSSENLRADDKTQECKTGNEKEVYDKKDGFQCCGIYYFNTTLWFCEKGKLQAKTKV